MKCLVLLSVLLFLLSSYSDRHETEVSLNEERMCQAIYRSEGNRGISMNIPNLPRSGNYLEDCEDDRLSQEQLENKYDQAENACDDR